MNIGLGVFLGLVFCGLIYLYCQTKDRWNWTKASKVLLAALGIPATLGLISIAGIYLYGYYQALPKNQEPPQVITEFKDIKLSESLSDAAFKVGVPTKVGTAPVSQQLKGIETYMFSSFSVEATIRNNKVESVTYSCAVNQSDLTFLNGIMCGEKGDVILRKFNGDVRVLCHIKAEQKGPWSDYELLGRVYDVVKYGTRYYLTQNSVNAMEILSPENLKSAVGIEWDKCQ